MNFRINLSIMETIKLRQDFLNFFRKNAHKYLPQSKIFKNDDTSLLFVNSGMCQLKNIFLDLEKPKEGFTQLMNSQICIRASGKHNDLEDVGKDSYHLTLFEMLGNWSLNDYGKQKAIELAYDFLINECKLKKENMYVTYFGGTKEIAEDLDTKKLWEKYFHPDKIIPSSFKDNFWMMADNGPCGVSTEIHYDLIGGRDAKQLVNQNDPSLIEIWNLVFIQYNKINEDYVSLGKLYVDTGAGLSRLAMILQNKTSIYLTDEFKFLFGYCQALTGADFYTDNYDSNKDTAYRIFVDHIRTTIIALYQGVEFDCNKRGFVLRKIFRRMLNHLYIYLNNKTIEPKMDKKIIYPLISQVLDFFLEFKHDAQIIQNKLIQEEKLYLGQLKYIGRLYDNLLKKNNKEDIAEKLKKENGIDQLIFENIKELKFKHF